MHKLYLVTALALSLTSCDTLTQKRLPGTYQRVNDKDRYPLLKKFELTSTKFIMPGVFGEAAMDYTVEDDYLYAGPKGGQIRFKLVNSDTLRAEAQSAFEGTYVRVK